MTLNRRAFLALSSALPSIAAAQSASRTVLTIDGEDFRLNGRPTYAGRTWNGLRIEGLLMNFRAAQGIFDDLNPATAGRWAYPDTGKWDAQRNTREFVAAMPEWRSNGVLSFTVSLQGGSPEGYSNSQPWENSALDRGGELKPDYMTRLASILDRADALRMAPIVGCYYFGQDQRLKDEAAVRRGVENTAKWLLGRGYQNVMLEVANECDWRDYDHAILRAGRIHELIEIAKSQTRNGRRLLVGKSFSGGVPPTPNVVRASDFLLLHGNGADDPGRVTRMVEQCRRMGSYRPMPIVINEDDHFRFDEPSNHFRAALAAHCSWGYFDPGKNDYAEGYQCLPVNWGINTSRKRSFFAKVKEITGA